jgi:hypothetical protein
MTMRGGCFLVLAEATTIEFLMHLTPRTQVNLALNGTYIY